MKIALVVGHNPSAQGAYSHYLDETEYGLWSEWAPAFRDRIIMEQPRWLVEVFYREAGPREIRKVYGQVDRFAPDFSVELHFNSYHSESARGTETLSSGSTRSMALCGYLQNRMVQMLGLTNRGVKTVSRHQRGGANLHLGRAPAALVEPFFGSCETDARAFNPIALQEAFIMAFTDYEKFLGDGA